MATPSLAMIPSAYADSKLYSVIPNNGDGDFTFDRASTATRVGQNGLIETVAIDLPRLNYDISNGVVQSCPSLLLEPASTNLVPYSEDFSNAAWNKIAATITTNSDISPDGTQNSDLFVPSSSGGQIYDGLGSKAASAITYTTSLYVKQKGLSSLRIYLHGTSNADRGDATFNLSNQTVSFSNNGAFTNTSASMLNVGNGWYRCILVTTSDTSTSTQLVIRYDGSTDNVSGLNIWGCQTEEQSYPTSYIPTTGAIQTRAAETCFGAGTSSTFNSTEGVLYVEIKTFSESGSAGVISLNDGSNTNRVKIELDGGQIKVRIDTTAGQVASLNYTIAITNYLKIAVKWKADDYALWINGIEGATDTSGASFVAGTLSELSFDRGDGVEDFYGNTKDVRVYNEALTDLQLQKLTTL